MGGHVGLDARKRRDRCVKGTWCVFAAAVSHHPAPGSRPAKARRPSFANPWPPRLPLLWGGPDNPLDSLSSQVCQFREGRRLLGADPRPGSACAAGSPLHSFASVTQAYEERRTRSWSPWQLGASPPPPPASDGQRPTSLLMHTFSAVAGSNMNPYSGTSSLAKVRPSAAAAVCTWQQSRCRSKTAPQLRKRCCRIAALKPLPCNRLLLMLLLPHVPWFCHRHITC